MPTEAQLVDALTRADAAGDHEGAAQLASMIQQMRGSSTPPAQTAQQRASAAGQAAGAQESPLMAAIGGAAHAGTLGLMDYIGAGARYAGQRAVGVDSPDNFDTDLAYTRGVSQGATSEHPVANVVGNVAGVLMGGGALSAGAKAAEALPVIGKAAQAVGRVLAPQSGQPVANVARTAIVGGAGAGAQSALSGDTPAQIGVNTAAGAVIGPAAGYAAQGVAKAIAPLPMKTARLLAKMFGESADDVATTWSRESAAAGRPLSMREFSTLAQAGKIRGAAANNSVLVNTLIASDDTASAARSTSMAHQFAYDSAGRPTTSSADLEAWTKKAGDSEFGAVRNQTFPLSPEDNDFLQGDVMPYVSLSRAAKRTIAEELDRGELSVGSADILRRNLRDLASAKPGQGFYERMGDVNDLVSAAVPEYRAAVQNYAKRAQITEGAKLGEQVLGGNDTLGFLSDFNNSSDAAKIGVPHGVRAALYNAAQTPDSAGGLAGKLATDDGLYQRLAATIGQPAADRLRNLGQAEATAAERVAQTSPRSPVNAGTGALGSSATHALGAVASHSPTGVAYHAAQLVRSLPGVRLSPAVQAKVAGMLTDPRQTQQAINYLRKAGAADADLRRLTMGISTSAGSAAAGTQVMAR